MNNKIKPNFRKDLERGRLRKRFQTKTEEGFPKKKYVRKGKYKVSWKSEM